MEAIIADGNIGNSAKYSVAFKEGKLVAELDANEGAFVGGLVVKIDAGQVLDAIAKAVPGQLDDAVIAIIKAALLK